MSYVIAVFMATLHDFFASLCLSAWQLVSCYFNLFFLSYTSKPFDFKHLPQTSITNDRCQYRILLLYREKTFFIIPVPY